MPPAKSPGGEILHVVESLVREVEEDVRGVLFSRWPDGTSVSFFPPSKIWTGDTEVYPHRGGGVKVMGFLVSDPAWEEVFSEVAHFGDTLLVRFSMELGLYHPEVYVDLTLSKAFEEFKRLLRARSSLRIEGFSVESRDEVGIEGAIEFVSISRVGGNPLPIQLELEFRIT
jgi:hypothetical protein